MSRIPDGATRTSSRIGLIAIVVLGALLGSACKEIDGRNANRRGNRLFRDTQFIDAAAEYEKALKTVEDPIIHYNLGLAYSKMYRAGLDKPVLLGEQTDPVCGLLPSVKIVDARVCIKRAEKRTDDKENVRRYPECNEKDICSSSYECKQSKMCAADSPVLADLAAKHFQIWIKAQPSDAELKKKRDEVREELKAAEAQNNKSAVSELGKKLEDLSLKDSTRNLTTQVWIETEQFPKAIAYWEAELAAKPKDPEIMGNLAGINLKANDWRKSIEWYLRVVEVSPEVDSKVASLQFIGNVAWSKLNSKALSPEESVELADRGIGALQKASELAPKLAKLLSLQASLFGFRARVHGASFAQAIDRASAEDLRTTYGVLNKDAKKQQPAGAPAPAPTPPPNPAPPASGSMSSGSTPKSGG